jgi:RNA polymerase sigma-70 factor (ECF subfamily)
MGLMKFLTLPKLIGGDDTLEDLSIIDEVLASNSNAYELIVKKYEKSILRFIYSIVKNKEAAEDLSQETFITAYQKLYSYSRKHKFSNWLYQIARNKSMDYLRKNKEKYNENLEEAYNLHYEFSVEAAVEFNETKMLIRDYIETLKPLEKHILSLKYTNESLTFNDIAEIVKMSEAAVKWRYYKICNNFSKYSLKASELGNKKSYRRSSI